MMYTPPIHPRVIQVVKNLENSGFTITSAYDKKHNKTSRHYLGTAFDVRTWKDKYGTQFRGQERENYANRCKQITGPSFFFLDEGDHFHFDYRPTYSDMVKDQEEFKMTKGRKVPYSIGAGSLVLMVLSFISPQDTIKSGGIQIDPGDQIVSELSANPTLEELVSAVSNRLRVSSEDPKEECTQIVAETSLSSKMDPPLRQSLSTFIQSDKLKPGSTNQDLVDLVRSLKLRSQL